MEPDSWDSMLHRSHSVQNNMKATKYPRQTIIVDFSFGEKGADPSTIRVPLKVLSQYDSVVNDITVRAFFFEHDGYYL